MKSGFIIALVLIVLCSGCITQEKEEETTTLLIETTTTTMQVTTTVLVTTSTTSTTTTSTPTLSILCHANSDCGTEREERVCYNRDVYLKKISPLCKNPGKTNSYCVQKESWVTGSIVAEPIPLEKCNKKCINETCL